MVFHVGQRVEIAGTAEEGFGGSFAAAQIQEVGNVDGRTMPSCKVVYDEFVSEDGSKLEEVFPVRSPRMRPAPPTEVYKSSLDEYPIGTAVDWYDNDCWWQGVVMAKNAHELIVYFPDVDDVNKRVADYRLLRQSMEWVKGRWQPRQPSTPIMTALQLQHQAMQQAAMGGPMMTVEQILTYYWWSQSNPQAYQTSMEAQQGYAPPLPDGYGYQYSEGMPQQVAQVAMPGSDGAEAPHMKPSRGSGEGVDPHAQAAYDQQAYAQQYDPATLDAAQQAQLQQWQEQQAHLHHQQGYVQENGQAAQ